MTSQRHRDPRLATHQPKRSLHPQRQPIRRASLSTWRWGAQVADETGVDCRSVARNVSCARHAIRDHLERKGVADLRPRARRKALRR